MRSPSQAAARIEPRRNRSARLTLLRMFGSADIQEILRRDFDPAFLPGFLKLYIAAVQVAAGRNPQASAPNVEQRLVGYTVRSSQHS